MTKIAGKRINLRPLKSSDAKSVYENCKTIAVLRYLLLPKPYKYKDAVTFIKKTKTKKYRQTHSEFGIELKDTGQIIGVIGLKNISKVSRHAEVGYWLGKKYHRQGIMSEALGLLIKYSFVKLKLVRIWAMVLSPNRASAKLLESKGFELEGHLKKHIFRNNRWYDVLYYGLLK